MIKNDVLPNVLDLQSRDIFKSPFEQCEKVIFDVSESTQLFIEFSRGFNLTIFFGGMDGRLFMRSIRRPHNECLKLWRNDIQNHF